MMRGLSSILVGLLLIAVASWNFTTDGFGSATLICGVAAAFFFFLGARGMTVGEAGNPIALVDFVRDPAGAIVDTATDRIGDWLSDDKPAAAQPEQPKFDADAAIARYLAQRPEPSAAQAAAAPAASAPVRGFGRKGV